MRRFFATLALVLAVSSSAWAAVLIKLELPQLVEQSDYIVVARAENQSSRFSKGLIVTDVSLRVISVLKGSASPGASLIATHLGGSVDDLALTVPGAARFSPDQSAIVFLRRSAGRPELQVTGMSQGVMPILGIGPKAQVGSGGADAALMQRDSNGALTEAAPTASQSRMLNDVIGEIEQLVAGAH